MIDPTRDAARRHLARIAADASVQARPVCFDSAALIAYIGESEPLALLVGRLLLNTTVGIVISTVTVAEVVTRPAMQGDHERIRTIHRSLVALPNLTIVDFDHSHAIETANVRAATGLRLPVAAVVATARLANATALIGNDRQWRHKPLGLAKSDGLPSLLTRVVEAMTPLSPAGMPLCRCYAVGKSRIDTVELATERSWPETVCWATPSPGSN